MGSPRRGIRSLAPGIAASSRWAGWLLGLGLAIVVAGCSSAVATHSLASTSAPSVTPGGSETSAKPAVAPLPKPTGRSGTFTAMAPTNLPDQADHGNAEPALQKDGKVLVVGDGMAVLYDPTTGQFRSTGVPVPNPSDLDYPGMDFEANGNEPLLLADGRVLTLGIWDAEVYDPSTGAFTVTGHEASSHSLGATVLLKDGRVLAIGGAVEVPKEVASGATVDVFDPTTGKFSRTGSMKTGRDSFTATRLRDGRVLVAGGEWGTQDDGSAYASAEIYDPATGKWSRTGSMTTPRYDAAAILLDNGRVLVTGGQDDDPDTLSSAELYDPTTGKFTKTGSMSIARSQQTAALLGDGRVLIAGGSTTDAPTDTAEIYDPSLGTFSQTGSMTVARWIPSAVTLPDGSVLVIGGFDTPISADLYWP
jgi:Galactose oxidase, central domain